MTLVWVGKHRVDVDLVDELQSFHWEKERWTDEKLTACSPFRFDGNPSFFVNLEDIGNLEIAGSWKDSGAGTSGNFIELMAHLMETDYDSALDYLFEKYMPVAYEEDRKLHPWKDVKEFKPLSEPHELFSQYLYWERKISVQTQLKLGVSGIEGRVTFPWRNPKGDIMAIKYRLTNSKRFSYEKDGYRINQLLFGIDQVYASKATTLWICEAEIDALTVWENGYAAVALGGSSISDRQAEMIIQSGVERIVIASDNDKAGDNLKSKIKKKLHTLDTYSLQWKNENDDVNAYYLREGCLPKVHKEFNFWKRIKKLGGK